MLNKGKFTVTAVLFAIWLAGTAFPAAAPTTDAVLDSLPENCVVVIRVNNLNDAMTKLDAYLAGASPMPLSMMLNMQLVSITGDAMLNGIDKSGSFVLFAVPAGEEEVKAGLLVPVTSFADLAKNQNITKLDEKLSMLSAPDSNVGAVVLAPALGGKYALAVHESEKDSMPLLQQAIENKTAKRLSTRLNAVQSKEAVSVPAWAFVNLAAIYSQHGEEMLQGLEGAMTSMAADEKTAGMMQFATKMYSEMFKTFAGDTDSLTLAIKPEAALLTVDTVLRAKDGSPFAQMLVADPAGTQGYKLAGYTDNSYAVNVLTKINQPFFTKLNESMLRIMETSAQDGYSPEEMQKMKGLMTKWMDLVGKEFAVSFSYGGGMPPVRFHEIVELKQGTSAAALMSEGLEMVNSMYKSMGMPFMLSYQPGTETYKQIAIDTIKIAPTEAAKTAPEFVEMSKMMGPEGMSYYMAQKGSQLILAMGPKGVDEIKALIDQPADKAVAGDMKTALDTLNGTGYTDMAASINIIRLMKGMGEMIQTMGGEEQINPFKSLSGMNLQSQSCLVMGGKVADGQLGMRIALPKQHLLEIVTAAMQIQQQMLQQQQAPQEQQEPNQAAEPQTPAAAALAPQAGAEANGEQASELKTWVGKKAPELRMMDLSGQTHRISRLKGKKVVLDFWATWCPPCKESIPHLIALRGKTSPETAAIIGLTNEEQEKVAAYVKDAGINYPIAIYGEDLPAPYGQVTGLPTMFLIDAEGTITDVIEGYDPQIVSQKLDAFLK